MIRLRTRSSAVAVIVDRTANDVRHNYNKSLLNSRTIRFNRLELMNAPKLNPLMRDEQFATSIFSSSQQ